MTGAATTTRLPSIAHMRRSPRHDEIVPVTKKHVAAEQNLAAIFGRGEIDFGTGVMPLRVEVPFAMHAEPSDATVRKDVEPEMREGPGVMHGKRVARVAL